MRKWMKAPEPSGWVGIQYGPEWPGPGWVEDPVGGPALVVGTPDAGAKPGRMGFHAAVTLAFLVGLAWGLTAAFWLAGVRECHR